ncbi:hypothetical protein [Embleya sp. NBC_00896]|uniref:hypothetical protein n=1 Tax=Embleya sp. NBC_00896 TaxID=2975961 RepID=UPI00386F0A1E
MHQGRPAHRARQEHPTIHGRDPIGRPGQPGTARRIRTPAPVVRDLHHQEVVPWAPVTGAALACLALALAASVLPARRAMRSTAP